MTGLTCYILAVRAALCGSSSCCLTRCPAHCFWRRRRQLAPATTTRHWTPNQCRHRRGMGILRSRSVCAPERPQCCDPASGTSPLISLTCPGLSELATSQCPLPRSLLSRTPKSTRAIFVVLRPCLGKARIGKPLGGGGAAFSTEQPVASGLTPAERLDGTANVRSLRAHRPDRCCSEARAGAPPCRRRQLRRD